MKHSLGHGIGLDVHEHPPLADIEGTRLENGMVIAVEPGAYEAGNGGSRLENDVIIGKNGFEKLTKSKLISV